MSKTVSEELQNIMHNITWIRKDRGLTKKRMAEILNISVSTLNKIERNEFPRKLRVQIVYDIYDEFGVTPGELIDSRMGE